MKLKFWSKLIAVMFCGTALCGDHLQQITRILQKGGLVEMPVRAAKLVSEANATDRNRVTVDVVTAALTLTPAAAPTIVSSICKSASDMAAIAAGTAAKICPKQAADITTAACVAAPGQVSNVVYTICRVVPVEYQKVALAAGQSVPGSTKLVMMAIAAAIPELKGTLQNILSAYQGELPPVAVVLNGINRSMLETGASPPAPPLARGPSLQPPYIPPSQTSSNVNPSTSGTVPRGGRNYAAP
jgi:hypothetical protein